MSFDPGPSPWDEDAAPPHSLEAEHAVLGAALYDNDAYRLVEDQLRPEHFYEPFHGRIWDVISTRVRSGQLAEMVWVHQRLKDDAAMADVGGLSFLGLLVDRAPSVQSVGSYAAVVADCAVRRNLITVGQAIAATARRAESEAGMDQVLTGERMLSAIARDGPSQRTFTSLGAVYLRQLHRSRALGGAPPGLRTGVPALDAVLGGLRPSTVNTFAGRPGMGKSVWGIEAAKNIARPSEAHPEGMGVAFFSAEMPEEQVATRFGCSLVYDRMAPVYGGKSTNPTFEEFEKGELTEVQWNNLERGYDVLREMPIEVDFLKPKVSQMQASVRRLQRDWRAKGIKPGLIVMDHLLHIAPEKRLHDKVAEITQISNDTLDMAKSLEMPVLLLTQLNRGVEGREDKRPGLQDLKWAGAVEEDSFSVTFMYRPEYYNKQPEDENDDKAWAKWNKIKMRWANRILFLIEKNRGGRSNQQVEAFCDVGCNVIQNLDLTVGAESRNFQFPTEGSVFGGDE